MKSRITGDLMCDTQQQEKRTEKNAKMHFLQLWVRFYGNEWNRIECVCVTAMMLGTKRLLNEVVYLFLNDTILFYHSMSLQKCISVLLMRTCQVSEHWNSVKTSPSSRPKVPCSS